MCGNMLSMNIKDANLSAVKRKALQYRGLDNSMNYLLCSTAVDVLASQDPFGNKLIHLLGKRYMEQSLGRDYTLINSELYLGCTLFP